MNDLLQCGVGIPLLLGCGICLTLKTGFVQIRLLIPALKEFFSQLKCGGGGFRPLCTALAATVGTGNIAGVAGAIALGGPGAVFWMWVSGFIGMATKFAEATLAVAYRVERKGIRVGGPMYIMDRILGQRWMGLVYAALGILASFGVGNGAQVNAVVESVTYTAQVFGCHLQKYQLVLLAIGFAALVFVLTSGGARKIGEAAELLVPAASCIYFVLCTGVLLKGGNRIGDAFFAILQGAFSPRAVTGGTIGCITLTLRNGVSRGLFTNEAGMGTAAIAHADASVDHPVRQGLMGIVEVFFDTIVICTMTALAILVSGVPIGYGMIAGSELTSNALQTVYGSWSSVLLSGCLILFALATILGWGMYAGRCAEFLFGSINWKVYGMAQGVVVFLSFFGGTEQVWVISEFLNILMVIPNVLMLCSMSRDIQRLEREFRLDYLFPLCYDNACGGGPPVSAREGKFHDRKGNRRDSAPHTP